MRRCVSMASVVLLLALIPALAWGLMPKNRTENLVLLGVVTAPAESGVTVMYVLPKSPAAQAGMKPGDRLLEVNKKKLSQPSDLDAALEAVQPGQPVVISMRRKNKTARIAVKVIDRKAYKGDFLAPRGRQAKGFAAPEWFAYGWTNVPENQQPPTLRNTRGKVVVIHAFQGW